MKGQALPTLIGAFIIGALLLLSISVVFYVTRTRLETQQTFILYFQGSLKGLHVGSAVTYRGIKVGRVIRIQMQIDPKTDKISIPVFVEFYRTAAEKEVKTPRLEAMIERGMRARLEKQSLFSGDLAIALVKRPDVPAAYRYKCTEDCKYIEIPAVGRSSEGIEIGDTLQSAKTLLDNFNKLVTSAEIKNTLKSVDKGAKHFSVLMKQSTVTVNNFDKAMQPTIKNINKFVYNLNDQLNPILVHLNAAMGETKDMMYAIRILTEYLSRQPSSIIVGKGQDKNGTKVRSKR